MRADDPAVLLWLASQCASSRPDLARALEFYDRWLPNTMRRIAGMTRACMTQCVMLRRPGDAVYVQRR